MVKGGPMSKREPSIRLSPKHGLNPTIPTCFFCNKEKNEVALLGLIKGDAEAPRGVVLDKNPCNKCEDLMKQGIILISVRNEEEGDNPYRTGGWVVVKDDFIKRAIPDKEFAADIIKWRVAFVPDAAWDLMGLPREANGGEDK
jgi:hypothetical protein